MIINSNSPSASFLQSFAISIITNHLWRILSLVQISIYKEKLWNFKQVMEKLEFSLWESTLPMLCRVVIRLALCWIVRLLGSLSSIYHYLTLDVDLSSLLKICKITVKNFAIYKWKNVSQINSFPSYVILKSEKKSLRVCLKNISVIHPFILHIRIWP